MSWSLDDFAGNNQDPQSFHKYLYTHADPVNGFDPTGQFSLGSLISATVTGGIVGGIGGAAVGAVHGGIKGGLEGAKAGALSGLLWGAAAGASIGAGGYLLGTYFLSLGGVSIAQAYGGAIVVAGIPWRVANSFSLKSAIKSGDPVDISFATLGFILGYSPVTEGVQFNATIAAYFRTLPFVKNSKVVTPSTANKGFANTETWRVPFAGFRWAVDFITAKPIQFIRVMGPKSDPKGGKFLVLKSEVKGMTDAQIKQYLALNFMPESYQTADVPVNSALRAGQVGPQPKFDVHQNGGLQFMIPKYNPKIIFGDPIKINSRLE